MLVKSNKKIMIIAILLFSLLANSFQATSANAANQETSVKLQNAIDLSTKYVTKNQLEDNPYADWNAVALKQAGKSIDNYYLDHDRKLLQSGQISTITDFERTTLGVLAAGGDPNNFEGVNLLEHIYNGETNPDLMGLGFALISLDSANFKIPDNTTWTREKLKNEIIAKQNQDGGWPGWDGITSDIDTTAMMLTALSQYKEEPGIQPHIDSALQFIQNGVSESKIDNSSTAAQVIIALSALSIDANSGPYLNNGSGLVDLLFTFQISDGGFTWKYIKDGGYSDSSDPFSTDQAFRGLVAYQLYLNGKGSLYKLPILENSATGANGQQTQQQQKQPDQTALVDQAQTVNTANNSNTNVNSTANGSATQQGKPLPNTATNNANLLLIGALLLFSGVTMIYLKRRKHA